MFAFHITQARTDPRFIGIGVWVCVQNVASATVVYLPGGNVAVDGPRYNEVGVGLCLQRSRHISCLNSLPCLRGHRRLLLNPSWWVCVLKVAGTEVVCVCWHVYVAIDGPCFIRVGGCVPVQRLFLFVDLFTWRYTALALSELVGVRLEGSRHRVLFMFAGLFK